MANFIYQRIPVDRFDTRQMEAWLEEQSEKGLILAATAAFIGIFRKEEPCRRKCRILPADLFPEKEREERFHLYQRFGWECTAGIGGSFLVFMAAQKEPEPVPEDVASGYKRLKKGAVRNLALWLSAAAIVLTAAFAGWIAGKGLYTGLMGNGPAGWLMLLMLFFAGILPAVSRLRHTLRSARPAGSGEKEWRKTARLRTAGLLLYGLAFLGAGGALIFQQKAGRYGNYDTAAEYLPAVSLAELEGADEFVYGGRLTEDGMQIDNFYRIRWRLLAPENYQIIQSGRAEEDADPVTLRTDCRKAAFVWLAKGYYREMRTYYEQTYGQTAAALTADSRQFDEGAVLETPDGWILLIRSGKWTAVYRYEGSADPAQIVSMAAEKLPAR